MKYLKNFKLIKRSFSSEIKFCELYKSKFVRIYYGDYPPLPCYAMTQLHDDHVKNTTCDCEDKCKFDPDDFHGGITGNIYIKNLEINTSINLSNVNKIK